MIRRESIFLEIPFDLYHNRDLLLIHKVTYALFLKYQGDKEKIIAEMGIKERRFQYIKSALARAGWLAKIKEKGSEKYVPVDRMAELWARVKKLMTISREGFNRITDSELLQLQGLYSVQRLYAGMALLEKQYRESDKKKIEKPFILLKKTLKNLRIDADFNPDWWMKELKPAAAIREDAENPTEEEVNSDTWNEKIEALPEAEKKALREKAIKEIEANGGLPKLGKEITIRIQMRKIMAECKT